MIKKISLTLLVIPFLVFAQTQSDHPNILLLMAEDMSPRVGAFGDSVAVTPNIDKLASEGVRYPNTFTTAGVCAPSRAATIMGVHQISFGGQHMRASSRPEGGYKAVPPAHMKAFPEHLRAAGYYTYTTNKLDYQFSSPFPGTGPFTIWDAEGSDPHWRDAPPEKPFFGYLNFPVTHESGVFTPLGHWPSGVMHFVMQVLRAWKEGLPPANDPVEPAQIVLEPYYPDTPTVRNDIARHYNNIAILDQQVGEVLDQLEQDGLVENTIVIWTTDHGDGLPRAKRELYDSGIKVPMVIRWPEKYRPANVKPGEFDERLISFVDLAPTILALAGVKIPVYTHGQDLTDNNIPKREYIYASRDRIDEIADRQRAVRDTRFKYIRSYHPTQEGGHHLKYRDSIAMMREMFDLLEAGKLNEQQRLWFMPPGDERLFDLQADPHELNDVASDPAYTNDLARMRNAYAEWRERVEDWSDEPEATMVKRFQSGGEQQKTAAPKVAVINGSATITSASEGASIGYRLDNGDWQLYT
ncbi:MAG: sulfatase family protein, partial [Pseudomonadales bacterium]